MDGRCDVHGGGELGASAACVSSTDSGDRDLLRSPIDFRFRIFLVTASFALQVTES